MFLKVMVLAVPSKRLKAVRNSLKEVCARGNVEIKLDEEGNAVIEGEGGSEWIAEQVLKAMVYGFEPRHALKLFSDEYFLEVIDLGLFLKNERVIARQKARIIGEGGRVKKNFEALTGAFLSVDGNDVGILGKFEELKLAKEGISKILDGKQISSVYAFLEKRKS